MKILFDNLALTAAISAAHENANYPALNLKHVFLKKVFFSTASADTLTLAWASDQIIDSVYLALTNGTAFELRLYGPTGTLLKTQAITSAFLCASFAAVSGVRTAQLDIAGATPVYLGTIGLGVMCMMPYPLNDWIEGAQDNSVFAESPDGQVLENHVAPLRKVALNFFVRSLGDYMVIRAKVNAMSRPIFIDFFEGSHSLAPMYGFFEGRMGDPSKTDKLFNFSLTAREAR